MIDDYNHVQRKNALNTRLKKRDMSTPSPLLIRSRNKKQEAKDAWINVKRKNIIHDTAKSICISSLDTIAKNSDNTNTNTTENYGDDNNNNNNNTSQTVTKMNDNISPGNSISCTALEYRTPNLKDMCRSYNQARA